MAAQKLGVPIDVHLLAPRDVAELADEVLPRLAEPVADPTLLPLLFLARRAARPGQVVLDGTGADVILAGTTKYTAEHYVRMYARVPRPLRRGLIEPLGRLLPSSRRWRLTSLARKWQIFTTMSALPERERQVFWTRFMPRPLVAEILAPQWLCAEDLGTSYLRAELERPGTDDIGALSYMTLKCHTPWVDLLKLHSVEQEAGISVRKPYLAPELVEFGLSLPDAFKVQGSQGKIALRKACEGLIPPGTLQRGKAIFATPISRWLGHDLRDAFWDTLLHPTGLFDIAKIRTMVRQDTLGWRDWQSELWAVFMLQRWWIANSQ
jgi:asparagine synthase (glutamine-hydrolysing)